MYYTMPIRIMSLCNVKAYGRSRGTAPLTLNLALYRSEWLISRSSHSHTPSLSGEGTPGWTLGRRDTFLTPAGVRTLDHPLFCISLYVRNVGNDWPQRGGMWWYYHTSNSWCDACRKPRSVLAAHWILFLSLSTHQVTYPFGLRSIKLYSSTWVVANDHS
jgi:hypothetical protein